MTDSSETSVGEDVPPLTAEDFQALPLFPLPRVVFFPGTLLPLRLFEPRYRSMIEDCMSTGPRAMAVCLLAAGWDADGNGEPRIHPVAGAGRIVSHEQLKNGTHNILLKGLARVRLEELPQGTLPYRRARATPIADRDITVPPQDVTALVSCATKVASVVRMQHPEFSLGVRPDDPPGRVADAIADRLISDVETRQNVLEAIDPRERVRLTTDAIGELLAMIAQHEKPS